MRHLHKCKAYNLSRSPKKCLPQTHVVCLIIILLLFASLCTQVLASQAASGLKNNAFSSLAAASEEARSNGSTGWVQHPAKKLGRMVPQAGWQKPVEKLGQVALETALWQQPVEKLGRVALQTALWQQPVEKLGEWLLR